ncbi:proto-oncogene serine/threonine-protein kinase mos isoform X1 [Hypanus sabinus]|uniref:proto-oncogene serine/threonine-protein kinase mos isoform X1 n=1 Tax=Hypanus sabinus TaxID=79690 RepID=UPI0028C46D43|nr:proto-oncogene serine/threonine-protein kinase mos isoform X1 [Hypanus sabinus]
MPSPIPVHRILPKGFPPAITLRACSSPNQLQRRQHFSFVKQTKELPQRPWYTVIWDELKLFDLLGSGGFGWVYKGTYYGNTVAIKKVRKCTKNNLAARQSFWAELNVAHLVHENIVKVVAATTSVPASPQLEDCVGTIIMEYVGGASLDHRIYNSADSLEVGECLRFSSDIVSGLSFLHSLSIVHLDLKPANVLLTDSGRCKIGDFGCSDKLAASNDLRPNGQLRHLGGTYTHRAPELLRGCNATLKADIYSFAITLWQMVSRDHPFSGDRQCVMYAVVAYNLRPPFSPVFNETLMGRRIRSVIDDCWAVEPINRPSAEQLLETIVNLKSLL